MKKVIQGKAYDTETATRIGAWVSGLPVADPNHCSEILFLKRTGEFFIYGVGGALSRYSTASYGGMRGGGERIMPITVEEAEAWARANLTRDEYSLIFCTVPEDDTRVSVSYSLNASTFDRIKRLAQERSTSQVAIVQELLDKALGQ